MAKLYRKIVSEEGVTLLWVVLGIVAMLAMVALVVDGSYAYAQRRRMQNAADAAAIAGARTRGLGGSNLQVDNAVNEYAGANAADSATWSYLNGGKTIRVTAYRTFTTFFAGIVGLPSMTASATAEASLDYISRTGNLIPMTIKVQNFVHNQTYELWGDEPEAPGSFGWVDWDGVPVGASELADNILHPWNSGVWGIGDMLPSSPGIKNASLITGALDYWKGKHVTIPIYDVIVGGGANTRYRIAGFAEFVLHDYNFHGQPKLVWGHFQQWVEPGEGGGSDFGVSSVRLTR